MCAIVTASVAGHPAAKVASALAAQDINVSTTVAEHNQFDTEHRGVHPLLRISPHYYNTNAELDQTVAAIDRLARQHPTA
jgi:selenocysteine lyase/cysteine desulfurase